MEENTKILSVGQTVPDLEIDIYHNEKFDKINLSKYRGQWAVLFFYPADFTFVCPTELEELANHYDEFKKLEVEIISVSTDTTFVHKAWHDQSPAIKKVQFPMAGDPTRTLSKLFGVYIENEGLARRGTFIIDPDGVIKALEIHDNGIGRNANELIRKIQAAQFIRKNQGEVCPASWKPGEKTLTPGINLVGKI